MMNKFLAVTALTFALGTTSAMAQTAHAEAGIPGEWEGSISEAFYTNASEGRLRADSEIRSNWGNLSEADRVAVTAQCARLEMSHADDTGGVQVRDPGNQDDRTEQMAAEGVGGDGDVTVQSGNQSDRTEQMAGGGAAAGQAAGIETDQAPDQAQRSEQMGDEGGTAPVADANAYHDAQVASVAHVCDIVETM